jgi:hypothetical protein
LFSTRSDSNSYLCVLMGAHPTHRWSGRGGRVII